MKSKSFALAVAAIILVSTAGSAQAESSVAGVNANADIQVQATTSLTNGNTRASTSVGIRRNATSTASTSERGNATSTAAKDKNALTTNGKATTTKNNNGKLTSEGNRSPVATFVHSLLALADREGGIGTQVRTIAQSQEVSASTTAVAVKKVNDRGPMHTFLAGSDYKNLGIIRSEIATTVANITKVKDLLAQVTRDADRAELTTQIKTLEDDQVKLEAYVTTHEDKFSLFGWFNKLFIK